MTRAELAALTDVRGYAAAGRISLTTHARNRMIERNVKPGDVRAALVSAVACKCPTCGSERWKQGLTPHVEVVDGRKFKADLAAKVCAKCGEAIVAIDELDRFEVEVALALARAGAHSGGAIRTMRKALGLSATALAELLDVSMETVSRWEHGSRGAPLPVVATLGAMVLDHAAGSTATADRLRTLRKGPRLAKVVRLDLRARRARA